MENMHTDVRVQRVKHTLIILIRSKRSSLTFFIIISSSLEFVFLGELFTLSRFLFDKQTLDQYQYLGNCPPTPPLSQQQSIDSKLGLMLG